MKKKRHIWTSIFLIAVICGCLMIPVYNYYASPLLRHPYKIYHKDNYKDTLRIAYIGDSWAYMHKSHDCRIAQTIEDSIHHPISVHSYGICGLTSKEIYEQIYNNPEFKIFMQERIYDYCFISAGINDAFKKMSSSYYKRSMEGIIDFLLANHIHPIILEIPDFNIVKAFINQKTDKIVLRRLSMLINSKSIDCKQEFRNALDELIHEKGYQDKVSIIRYKSWNKEYEKDLKRLYLDDGMHLNEEGYEVLDSMIAKTVSLHYASKHNLLYNIPK